MHFINEWTAESRAIRFEFHGGFMDGHVVVGKASTRNVVALAVLLPDRWRSNRYTV